MHMWMQSLYILRLVGATCMRHNLRQQAGRLQVDVFAALLDQKGVVVSSTGTY